MVSLGRNVMNVYLQLSLDQSATNHVIVAVRDQKMIPVYQHLENVIVLLNIGAENVIKNVWLAIMETTVNKVYEEPCF